MNGFMPATARIGVVSKRAAVIPAWREKIARAVERHGQLKELADQAGMTSPQLQKIASGANPNPRIKTLARIAEAMGTTFEELIAGHRPEGDSRHEHVGHDSGGAGLADSLRRALAEYEKTGQAPNDFRGDIMLAIFTLTRALQRGSAAEDVGGQAKEAQR